MQRKHISQIRVTNCHSLVRNFYVSVLLLGIASCKSIPSGELQNYRENLEVKTSTSIFECKCPFKNPEGEWVGGGPVRVGKGDIVQGLHPVIKKLMDQGMSSGVAVESYADQIGEQTELKSYNNTSCWTGSCGPGEYALTNLNDIRILRVIISTFPEAFAHQCTFAKDPKLLTTQTCPEIPGKEEFEILKERRNND